MIKEQIVSKYKIEIIDENGKLLVKIYNLNAKKSYNSLKQYYSFRSETDRTQYIEEFIKSVLDREEFMSQRHYERTHFDNPAKVGDILYSSWGYDQTNIDYYQVIKVTEKTVTIKPISEVVTESEMTSDRVAPVKDHFISDKKALVKRVKPSSDGYAVTIASYADAYLWDKKPKYQTNPMFGH